jgi:hypothetical protein
MTREEAEDLARKIMNRAGEIIFTSWGDRPINLRELTSVLLEEAQP